MFNMLRHMRTTLQLNTSLIKEAKSYAAATHRTLTALVEDALREKLARCRQSQPRVAIELPTFGEAGLLPGVDLEDSASLRDHMDRHEDER